jgi:hypothetical protein
MQIKEHLVTGMGYTIQKNDMFVGKILCQAKDSYGKCLPLQTFGD